MKSLSRTAISGFWPPNVNEGSPHCNPLQYSHLENSMDTGTALAGCSPWGLKESDMTERLHFHFSLSCIGEGNGNPLQCSCLENPRDRGASWAAVYGVAQSRWEAPRLNEPQTCLRPPPLPTLAPLPASSESQLPTSTSILAEAHSKSLRSSSTPLPILLLPAPTSKQIVGFSYKLCLESKTHHGCSHTRGLACVAMTTSLHRPLAASLRVLTQQPEGSC